MTDLAAVNTEPGGDAVGGGAPVQQKKTSWLAALVERGLPDFANPVFVKEVRQAQRGKVFAITLVVTLVLALFGASIAAIALSDGVRVGSEGQYFFQAIYSFLTFAVLVVVPFQAFVAMGAERDENTFEMLVLSNLKPRQIVLGKVAAALLQGLMFGLAFLPFLVTAFLLRGVDLTALTLIIGLTAFASASLSVFAVMLSAVVRNRFLRVMAMVALAGGLLSLMPFASEISNQWFRRPEVFGVPEFYAGLVQFLLFASAGTLLLFAVACNMLAHEEENRSTNIRLSVTLLTFVALCAVAYNVFFFPGSGGGMPREVVYASGVMGIFILTGFCIFFVLEPDALGRRVEPRVPRNGFLAFLSTPWLPGGSRALIYTVLHVVAIGVTIAVIGIWAHSYRSVGTISAVGPGSGGVSQNLFDDGAFGLVIAALYGVMYTFLPATAFRSLRSTETKRNVARFLAFVLPLLLIILPTIVGLFLGLRGVREFEHFGNPFHALENVLFSRTGRASGSIMFLMMVAGFLFVLSLRRMAVGFDEVQDAGRKRTQPPATSESV